MKEEETPEYAAPDWKQINETVYQEREINGVVIDRFWLSVSGGATLESGEAERIASLIMREHNSHKALLDALREAREIIKTWHGPDAWEIYDQHSPEMIRINAALALAEKES